MTRVKRKATITAANLEVSAKKSKSETITKDVSELKISEPLKKLKQSNQDPKPSESAQILNVTCQLKNASGETFKQPSTFGLDTTVEMFQNYCNALIKEEDEPMNYSFFVNGSEIKYTLGDVLPEKNKNAEVVIDVVYVPKSYFQVRPVARCTSSITAHTKAILCEAFSPNGKQFATGSADSTVRFWDLSTETPHHTCKGHFNFVFDVAWSPDGKKLASACEGGLICIWDPNTGKQIGKTIKAHSKGIHKIRWEPYHLNPKCRRLVSASADGSAKVWDTVLNKVLFILSHKNGIRALAWGGSGLIYTGSKDTTIKVWRAKDGILCKSLDGHAHWINCLSLSTDYALRTGPFDPIKEQFKSCDISNLSENELKEKALKRYETLKGNQPERLVSCSDDFTSCLWIPEKDSKPIIKMTGHKNVVADVKFSPDSTLIASVSFDKSVKLWNGINGQYICSFLGHVNQVFKVCWSPDSRYIISGGKDSTLKLWSVANKKLASDLPGHADQVFAVDWSTDGMYVASGGLDKVLKIWRK